MPLRARKSTCNATKVLLQPVNDYCDKKDEFRTFGVILENEKKSAMILLLTSGL